MKSQYLIKIKMFGRAKYDIRELVLHTSRQFNINVSRPIPHITLVGPFNTNDESRLVNDFRSICCNIELIDYIIEGIDVFTDTGVVYLNVHPSDKLTTFRRDLRDRLRRYCNLSEFDFVEPFAFHSTIAKHLSQQKVKAIQKNIRHDQKYNHRMLRATLLKNGKILVEYDFLLKRMLSRREALSKQVYERTMLALNEKSSHNTEKQIFVTSDLHLGHYNIIKYCRRPFNSLDDMDNTLVNNWNSTISKNDKVYFLGDLAFGKHSSTDYWLSKLNGNIVFFKGNHDYSINIDFKDSAKLTFGNIPFFLTHNPADVPADWKGWVIHGHHHNNHPDDYPFINYNKKTINVSVELTNYKPVNMNTILRLLNTIR